MSWSFRVQDFFLLLLCHTPFSQGTVSVFSLKVDIVTVILFLSQESGKNRPHLHPEICVLTSIVGESKLTCENH